MAKILVTGATGYIGKRLITLLLEQNHLVYALCRVKPAPLKPHDNLKILYGDLQDVQKVEDFPEDLDAAYYLMHSMSDISRRLLDTERQVAENFVTLIKKTKVKQIIYLSGIINEGIVSEHLSARLLVEYILRASQIPTTTLRASIIIGAGSSSFEIIRDLCEKLPIMVAPRWIESRCQPISIYDVMYYLEIVLLNPECFNQTFDIGGPDVVSFKELMLGYAEIRNLKRIIFTVPVLTPRLSSYWLVFVTTVPFSLARYLVDSMKANTVCLNKKIDKICPHTCMSYKEAIKRSLSKIEQNEVVSTWMDSWDVHAKEADLQTYIQVPTEAVFTNVQRMPLQCTAEECMKRIWAIGGDTGWYGCDVLWKARGFFDKLLGGIGLNRGRRHSQELEVFDSIDFWRVLKADKKERHLILYAEMKLPGEGWLEFQIMDDAILQQRATFRPKGVLGRLYWYLLTPIHYFLFKKMAKSIAKK